MYYNKDGGLRWDNAEESTRGKKEGTMKLFIFIQYNILEFELMTVSRY